MGKIKEKEFEVEIKEILVRVQKVRANSLGEAIDKAMEMYYSEEIVLDAEDFKDVDFNPSEEEKLRMEQEKEEEQRRKNQQADKKKQSR